MWLQRYRLSIHFVGDAYTARLHRFFKKLTFICKQIPTCAIRLTSVGKQMAAYAAEAGCDYLNHNNPLPAHSKWQLCLPTTPVLLLGGALSNQWSPSGKCHLIPRCLIFAASLLTESGLDRNIWASIMCGNTRSLSGGCDQFYSWFISNSWKAWDGWAFENCVPVIVLGICAKNMFKKPTFTLQSVHPCYEARKQVRRREEERKWCFRVMADSHTLYASWIAACLGRRSCLFEYEGAGRLSSVSVWSERRSAFSTQPPCQTGLVWLVFCGAASRCSAFTSTLPPTGLFHINSRAQLCCVWQ